MKTFMIGLLVIFSLVSTSGCYYRQVTEQDRRAGQEALTNMIQDTGLGMAGYDTACISALRQMVKEGKISQGQAQYLMSQTCKMPPQQPARQPEMELPMPGMGMPSLTCPICGMMGFQRMGMQGTYYVCPRGHAWR